MKILGYILTTEKQSEKWKKEMKIRGMITEIVNLDTFMFIPSLHFTHKKFRQYFGNMFQQHKK